MAKTYDKSRFFFGAQYSTYATKKKLKRKRRTIISHPKIKRTSSFQLIVHSFTCFKEAENFTFPSKAEKKNTSF